MSLYKLLKIGILMELLGECETLADALRYEGEKEELADKIAKEFIQTLWRLLMPDTNANLFMGMNNLPIDKQYSLRLFKKRITTDHVILALCSMDDCIVQENARKKDVATDIQTMSAFLHRTDKEILKLFRAVEPVFIMLDISYDDEEILKAYNRYLIMKR